VRKPGSENQVYGMTLRADTQTYSFRLSNLAEHDTGFAAELTVASTL
jgi:hypothetical protein